MSAEIEYGSAVNAGGPRSRGFDAFEANPSSGLFVLCDGANSCDDGGASAVWLGRQLAQDTGPQHALGIQARVIECHEEMREVFPEGGSTFVRVSIESGEIELSAVGDSFLWLFTPPLLGFGSWRLRTTLPRHVDGQGHPTQMVGSEVCDHVHVHREALPRTCCAVLMSDGPGAVLSMKEVAGRLGVLGRRRPSREDLDYLCRSLAQSALDAGCVDDVTVGLVWARTRRG